MSDYGWLQEVSVEPRGSVLFSDASVSDTTLVVEDGSDFDNEGGELTLNGETLAYDSVTDGENVGDPDTVNLSAPLAAAAATGDLVGILAGDQGAVDYIAHVSMGDEGDAVLILLTFEQRLVYPVGVIDPPARVEVADDMSRILDSPFRAPGIVTVPLLQSGTDGPRVALATALPTTGSYAGLAYYTGHPNEDPSTPASTYVFTAEDSNDRRLFFFLTGAGQVDDDGVQYPGQTLPAIAFGSRRDLVNDISSSEMSLTADSIALNGNISLDGQDIGGAWTTYTPTWTASSTNPTGHTREGWYQVLGKTCRFKIKITFTSGSNLGTGGAYFFTLPFTAKAGGILNPNLINGIARDISAPAAKFCNGYLNDTTNVVLVDLATGNFIQPGTYTWANGDVIWAAGEYEIA